MLFYKIIRGIAKLIFRLIYRIEIIGEENLSQEGKLIICANHIHVFDPIILAIILPKQIHFMAKKELFENKILNSVFLKLGAIPVSRGGTDLSAVKNSLRILKADKVLGIFPEGTRVKEFDIKNSKPGTALISFKSKSPILPIYIESNYKIFSKIKVYVGKTIEFSDKYDEKLSNKDYNVLGEEILKTIYSLKNN